MKDFSLEQKKQLRDKIVAIQQASGLSGNRFAEERLGFSNGSKFSHVKNNWAKPGMVGLETWENIEKHISATQDYKGVKTDNLKQIVNACNRAYSLKKPIPIIGVSGSGKTFAINAYKKDIEEKKSFKVVLFDASETKTSKQFIAGLLEALRIHKPGNTATQLRILREHTFKKDMLLIIDEISSLKDHHVVIIKDVMTALEDKCGIIYTGTPYFINNLNNGAIKDKHLYREARGRLFMIPEILNDHPTESEALEIFQKNGITSKEELDIVMGRKKEFKNHSWLVKQSFRGIKDCIDMLKMADIPEIDFDNFNL